MAQESELVGRPGPFNGSAPPFSQDIQGHACHNPGGNNVSLLEGLPRGSAGLHSWLVGQENSSPPAAEGHSGVETYISSKICFLAHILPIPEDVVGRLTSWLLLLLGGTAGEARLAGTAGPKSGWRASGVVCGHQGSGPPRQAALSPDAGGGATWPAPDPLGSAESWETFALCWPEGLIVTLPPLFSRPLKPSWEIFSFNTVDCRHPERASAAAFLLLSWTPFPPPESGGQVAFRLESGGDCGTLAYPRRRLKPILHCLPLSG